MKNILYGLGDFHWYSGYVLSCKLIDIRKLEPKEQLEIGKVYSKRRRKLLNFLKKVEPEIIFVEGLRIFKEHLIIPFYKGKIVYLDEYSEDYLNYNYDICQIYSRFYKKEYFRNKNLQKLIETYEEEAFRRYFTEKFKREKEWAKVIREYYKPPSAIIAGILHFAGNPKNDFKITIFSLFNELSFKGFLYDIVEILNRYCTPTNSLSYFLKGMGIELYLKDYLPNH
jgi:hypothetical protein